MRKPTYKSIKRYRGGNNPSNQPQNIAILFAGRVSSYEFVLNNLLDIKNRYNATIYCSLNELQYTEYIDKFCKDLSIPREHINIESTPFPDFLNHVQNYQSNNPKNGYSMFYHENKAFNMIANDVNNGKKFDCILYYRADIDSPDKLQIEMPKENTVYIPSNHDYNGINDRMAYGNFETMKKYCNVISSIDSSAKLDRSSPEMILKNYILSQGIDISRIQYNTRLYLKRNEKYKSEVNPDNAKED
jgi:hypothetical protein